MVTTKSGASTSPDKDREGNSNQAFKSPESLPTAIAKSTMKFDLAFQHLLDIVLKLRAKHCIQFLFKNDKIFTLQDMLSLERDDIIELNYKDQSKTLIPIKKHGIGFISSVQRLLHFLSCNGADIYKDWGSISRDNFTSF